MTASEFRDALKALELSQVAASRLLASSERAVRRWVAGDRAVPGPARAFLMFLVANRSARIIQNLLAEARTRRLA